MDVYTQWLRKYVSIGERSALLLSPNRIHKKCPI